MTSTEGTNDQAAVWNGPGGHGWVVMQDALDELFRPFEVLLADLAAAAGSRSVLDVGCGTGGTTLALARRVGADGACTGIDISEPMITAARERAAKAGVNAEFIRADAEQHHFTPERFDTIVSRFGVMFFADPVRAFENLHRATVRAGGLHVIVWRDPAENPFMTTAETAAAPIIELPPRTPGGPGQFAFADQTRVRGILGDAGWRDVDLQPVDIECVMAEQHLEPYLTQLGSLGRALTNLDSSTRADIIDAVLPAFDRFRVDGDVRFTAACWVVTAVA